MNEERCLYQSEVTYSLSRYKEFTRGYSQTAPAHLFTQAMFLVVLVAFYLFIFRYLELTAYFAKYMLVFTATYLVMQVFLWFRNRNGDIQYKRMLMANEGQPITNTVCFTENHILSATHPSGNSVTYSYEQVRWLFETKRLLVLVLDLRVCLLVDKNNLSGGSAGELKQFLFDYCLEMKPKRIRKCTFGLWLRRAQLTVATLALLLSVLNLPAVQEFTNSFRDINNNMSYTEIARELEAMGITGSDPEMIAQLDADWETYGKEYGPGYNKVLDLLGYLGVGDYDLDSMEWTPSENGVYWFDLECFYVDTMYTDFLRGVSALDSSSLAFTDIQEIIHEINWEDGTGQRSFSFTWNSYTYTIHAESMGDWFDLAAADDLNKIIRVHGDGRRLYFTDDQWQGCFVFYGDHAWAREFQRKTGIRLYTEASDI